VSDPTATPESVGTIELLIREIEERCDPVTRDRVRELVAAVLDLHAAGLRRMSELVGGIEGARLTADPLIGSLLLLHGIHPDGLEKRVRAALAEAEPMMAAERASVERCSVEEGRVTVQLARRPGGRSEVRRLVEQALLGAAPDAVAIQVDEVAADELIPLERLSGRAARTGQAG
jgi:hypothetical protein